MANSVSPNLAFEASISHSSPVRTEGASTSVISPTSVSTSSLATANANEVKTSLPQVPPPPANTVKHVIEILRTAGFAFEQLGVLAGSLQQHAESQAATAATTAGQDAASSQANTDRVLMGAKWGDEEVKMFLQAIRTFAHDLALVGERVNANGIRLAKDQMQRQMRTLAAVPSDLQASALPPELQPAFLKRPPTAGIQGLLSRPTGPVAIPIPRPPVAQPFMPGLHPGVRPPLPTPMPGVRIPMAGQTIRPPHAMPQYNPGMAVAQLPRQVYPQTRAEPQAPVHSPAAGARSSQRQRQVRPMDDFVYGEEDEEGEFGPMPTPKRGRIGQAQSRGTPRGRAPPGSPLRGATGGRGSRGGRGGTGISPQARAMPRGIGARGGRGRGSMQYAAYGDEESDSFEEEIDEEDGEYEPSPFENAIASRMRPT